MNQTQLIALLLTHPKVFIHQISRYYPFSLKQLIKYQEILTWTYVSRNRNIAWDFEIMNHFANQLHWDMLNLNPAAFTDVSLLDKFMDRIDWFGLDEINDDFSNFDEYDFSITSNSGLPWSVDFITKYEHLINFEKLSGSCEVKWTPEMIHAFHHKLEFRILQSNLSVPWNLELFDTYRDSKKLHPADSPLFYSDMNFIKKYESELNWHFVFRNQQLPWAELNLFEKWKDKANWDSIAYNRIFFRNNPNFFFEHLNKWGDKPNTSLSNNTALPFSIDFLYRYEYLWDWQALTYNKGMPWNNTLIDMFADKWEWATWKPTRRVDRLGNIVSEHDGLTLDFGIQDNPTIPLSFDFFERFEQRTNISHYYDSQTFWDTMLKPYTNEAFIDLYLKLI